MINERTTCREKTLFFAGTSALASFALQMHMFFNPDLAEAQQLENSRDLSLLKFGFDAEELGGDFHVGLVMPLLKAVAGELYKEMLFMSEVQQNQLYKIVCGHQNAVNSMHATSAQDHLFQPVVMAANLGVLLV
jgi:hypothetical protein